MRILFLTAQLPNSYECRSGVFNYWRIASLVRKGAQVDVIFFNTFAQPIRHFLPVPRLSKIVQTHREKMNLRTYLKFPGVTVKSVGTFHLPNKYAWPRWEQIYYWSSKRLLRRLITENFYDLIIASRVVPEGAVLSYFSSSIKCPVAVIAEGGEVLEDAFEFEGWHVPAQKVIDAGFKVVCVSQEMERIVREGKLFPDPLTIPNGYDSSLFSWTSKDSAEKGLDHLTKVISVGRISPVKGYDLLIQAMADLPDNFTLTLVGNGDERVKRQLESLVRKLSLEKRVTFIGDVSNSEVPSLLRKHDLFCMPSRLESFGIAALEAMGCGLPVVASSVGGLKNLVIEGFNGLRFEKENIEELQEKLSLAADTRWDRRTISLWAKENYDWELWADQILRFAKQ